MLTARQAQSKKFDDRKLAMKHHNGKWCARYGIADTFNEITQTVLVKQNKGWPYKKPSRVLIDSLYVCYK